MHGTRLRRRGSCIEGWLERQTASLDKGGASSLRKKEKTHKKVAIRVHTKPNERHEAASLDVEPQRPRKQYNRIKVLELDH